MNKGFDKNHSWSKSEIEVNQGMLTEEINRNLSGDHNLADYEQELYEKDRYIEGLKNEIRGLMSLHFLREKIL